MGRQSKRIESQGYGVEDAKDAERQELLSIDSSQSASAADVVQGAPWPVAPGQQSAVNHIVARQR